MAYGTYAELQAAILDELNRNGDTKTVAAIPGWIRLAEADIAREVTTRNVTRNTALSLASGEVTLPADVGEIESLTLNDTTKGFATLTRATPDFVAQQRALMQASGVPGWFAVVNGVLILAPSPDQTYLATVIYEPQVTPLAAQGDTNWFLTNHPDLYFYGALLHATGWLGLDLNGPEVQSWNTRYTNALNGLRREKQRHEYGGPLVALPTRAIGG